MSVNSQISVEFSHLPVASILVDSQGHILAANILAQEHLNTSEQRLKKRNLTQLIAPQEHLLSLLQRAQTGETVSSDVCYTLSGHKPYSLHLSAQSDQYISVVLIAEGNRLEAEAQSRRHEMAEAVSRIALERAHEIKNPLASLRGATQLLSEQVEGDSLSIVTHMLTEIDRIKSRVDGFLQIGPRANVDMQPVNIHALIDNVCSHAEHVQVQRAYDPSIPNIQAHEGRLRQAVENLWLNAIEAQSDVVIWETRIAHGVTLLQHKGMVLSLKITSNGHSIPKNIRKRLFEPYITAKERGNGLGLSIVQQVIQEHGGKVSFQSEHLRTTFTLYLPLDTTQWRKHVKSIDC